MNRAHSFSMALTVLMLPHAPILKAEEPVWSQGNHLSVMLRDGSITSGEVDARTDADALWLRARTARVSVSWPVSWSEIVGVQIGEDRMHVFEFKAFAQLVKSDVAEDVLRRSQARHQGPVNQRPQRIPDPLAGEGKWKAAEFPGDIPGAVRSLHIVAEPANWDHDADMDGLRVWVSPRDEATKMTPVEGVLSLRVIGRKFDRFSGKVRPVEMGQKNFDVSFTDFREGFGIYLLPIRGTEAADPSEFATEARVLAKLSVVGRGNFEAETRVHIGELLSRNAKPKTFP